MKTRRGAAASTFDGGAQEAKARKMRGMSLLIMVIGTADVVGVGKVFWSRV